MEEQEEEVAAQHVLAWHDIQCSLKRSILQRRGKHGKHILCGVCGLAGPSGEDGEPGGLFALLGPSGAGKSTLLDILAGRQGGGYAVSGQVLLDGEAASPRAVARVSGYVPQEDVLPGTSTVCEYLTFHAELRLPRSLSRAQRQRRVQRTLHQLGLAKLGDALIGDQFRRGLSGGEKRRLSLAAELLARPRLLFMDEPTTGLDSTNAAQVVDILAGLAAGGVTCVLSIHQPRPDMFRLLSRLLLLSAEGAMVYSGPSALAAAHFASLGHAAPAGVNVADFVLDTVSRAPPSEVARLVDAFRSSEVQGANTLLAERARLQRSYRRAGAGGSEERGRYCAGFGLQLRMLCGRLLRNAYRHPFLFWLQFAATLAVALCLGSVFRSAGVDTGGIQNRLGALFFMLLYLSFMSLGSLPVWREERLLFLRERAAGAYGTNAYFTAVVLFDILPLRVLPPFFFLLSYAMIGLRTGSLLVLARFAGALLLGCVTCSSLCMLVGIVAPSNATANVLGGVLLLTSALFSNFLAKTQALSDAWLPLARVSPIRLAFDALAINELHGVEGFAFTSRVSPDARVAVSGDGILRTFGFNDTWAAYNQDLTQLAASICVLLALCRLFL